MTTPTYIVKRRTVEAARPNRYGHKVRHGQWITLRRFPAAADAAAYARTIQGLYDVGVFHQGKRLP